MNRNETTVTNNDGTNRNPEPTVVNHPSSRRTEDVNSLIDSSNVNQNKKKNAYFQGVSKYSPINIDSISLWWSPRIAAIKKKQLDQSLNYAGFVNANNSPEEEDDVDPMKENYTYKEVMNSLCKKEFIETILKEIKNHTRWKHWTYCKKSTVPYSQILRSA